LFVANATPKCYQVKDKPYDSATTWAGQPFDPEMFLSRVGKGRSLRDYKLKETIFRQGEAADALFYIREGKVKLTVLSEQGKEAVIAIPKLKDFFGEGCLAGQPLRMSSAEAMPECSIMRLEKQHVVEVLHAEPEFSAVFTTYLLSRNMAIEADLVNHKFNNVEKRLATVLMRLTGFGKDGKFLPVIPKVRDRELTHDMLAKMIGADRSHVTVYMNKFRAEGLIDYNDGLEVHSSLLSVVLHD
jgi:CRP/FNR family cyclic AMP-dependent transcriptional regulator